MKTARQMVRLAFTASMMSATAANAAVVNVGDPAPGNQAADLITVSTTWTNNNTYNLQSQIYVMPGATLTIEPGTVIASVPTANGAGSLAVTRGGKIIARGTRRNPIIFTSTNDVATWAPDAGHPTGGDPTTGTWRAAANEWGNITIMGRGYVNNRKNGPGCTAPGVSCTNVPTCNANNISPMEGLVASVPGDPNVFYGGGDDNDDSGVLEYVSIRYGGRVVGLGNELNGLSLGGIGRATEISHVEIMNNVDDGVEIWGGTVNLKNISIWNIGDDSFDVDQGWRGKAQFVLIVQGYSLDAASGSGTCDKAFEIDGSERADDQPVTTAAIYNATVIGQPAVARNGITYRDGARVQMRNSIVMDVGNKAIRNDGNDGEGSGGYGLNGTLTFAQTWTTPFNAVPAHPNDCANPGAIYAAQSAGSGAIGQGFLNEVTNSVFFRNLNNAYNSAAPNEGADQVGVTIAGGSNAAKGNVVAAYGGAGNPDLNMPIAALNRTPVVLANGNFLRVTGLDPRAANDAVTSSAGAPNDGFFSPVLYRGAFGPDENWLCRWSAAQAYGFVIAPPGGCAPNCSADIVNSGTVGTPDLLALINAWGPCPPAPCPADLVAPFGTVGTPDLLALINQWGACPQ